MQSSFSPAPGSASEAKLASDARAARRAYQIKVADWAWEKYEKACRKAERNHRINQVLAGLSYILTPLSWPVVLRSTWISMNESPTPVSKPLRIFGLVANAILSLIPFLSGRMAFNAADDLKMKSEPKAPPVRKKVYSHTKEELKAFYKDGKKQFEKTCEDVPWVALKTLGSGAGEEKALAATRDPEGDLVYYACSTSPDEDKSWSFWRDRIVEDKYFPRDETITSGQRKWSKIFVEDPKQDPDGKPRTTVYVEENQDIRFRFFTEDLHHRVDINNMAAVKFDRYGAEKRFPKEQPSPDIVKRGVTAFFRQSVIRSVNNVAALEKQYEEAMAKEASKNTKSKAKK